MRTTGGHVGRRAARGRRGAWTCAAIAITGASLSLTAVAPAGAQTPAPASTTSSTTTTTDPNAPFRTGDARATADTFSLNVKAANATIGLTYGRSIAGYQDRTGSAEARALDLGALPALFGGAQCDGSAPLLDAATSPPKTTIDSFSAGAEASRRTEAFLPGINGGPKGDSAGFQDATATSQPSSRATTESANVDIALIAMSGGQTETTAGLDGRVRTARAIVTADELRVFGGLFTFYGPRWEATTRSGDVAESTGTFTFERATVLGLPRSSADAMADLEGFKAGLEQLLAPLGVVLELPRVEVREDGVKVTPMGLRITDPPFGTEVLVPFLGQIDPLVQSLRTELLQADCKNAAVLTIVDVLLGVIGGSGSVEALAGGVDVSTRATDYTVVPFPDLPAIAPLPPPSTTPAPLAQVAGSELSSDGYQAPRSASVGATRPLATPTTTTPTRVAPVELAAPAPATATAPRAAVLPAAATNRFEDGSAGRAGVVVGVLAVLGALALSLGDRLRGRRTRRTIP